MTLERDGATLTIVSDVEPTRLYAADAPARMAACQVTGVGEPIVETGEDGAEVTAFGGYHAVATYETPEDAVAVAAFLAS